MKSSKTQILLLFFLLLSCGKDSSSPSKSTDAFEGVYEVTAQTETADGCDGEELESNDTLNYFKLKLTSFLGGAKYLAFNECDSETSCEDNFVSIWHFDSKSSEDTWTGEGTTSISGSVGSETCYLSKSPVTATLIDEEITMERKTYSGEGTKEKEQSCIDEDVSEALWDEYGDSLTCTSLKKIVATKVSS